MALRGQVRGRVQGVRDRPMCWLLTVGNGTPQSSADVCLEVSLGRRTFRMHVDADPRASCRPCGPCLGPLSIPGGINVEALSIGRVMPAARSRDNEGAASGRRGRCSTSPTGPAPTSNTPTPQAAPMGAQPYQMPVIMNRSRWPSKPRATTADTIVIIRRYATSYTIREKRPFLAPW